MDISVYNTQQAAGTGKPAAAGAQAGSATSGVFGVAPGMTFMDLIFARLAGETKTADGKNLPAPAENAAHPLLNKIAQKAELVDMTEGSASLTLEQLVETIGAEDPALLETAQNLLQKLTASETAPESQPLTPALKKKVVDLLNSLLTGLPQDAKVLTYEIAPGKTLTAVALPKENGNAEQPALIATGLTPEDLTRIIEDIANGNENGTIPGIAIIAVQNENQTKDVVFLPRGAVAVKPQHQAGEIATPQKSTGQLAAQLNALTTGETGEGAELAAPEFGYESDDDFEGVLRILQRSQGKGAEMGAGVKADMAANAAANAGKNVSPGLSTALLATPAPGAMTESFSTDIYPDGFDFSIGANGTMTLSGPAVAASLVAHAQHATSPHPASQMVAATIAKASAEGESKNITLHLNPPELGKVQVRLEFKDNVMKAHMVIEKPETFMMLQRDAQLLERALQQSGMDVNSDGGLSFELAQDGNAFGNDNQQGTGGNSGGGSGSDDGETETAAVIEMKMDWYVDPETGLTRYDALV